MSNAKKYVLQVSRGIMVGVILFLTFVFLIKIIEKGPFDQVWFTTEIVTFDSDEKPLEGLPGSERESMVIQKDNHFWLINNGRTAQLIVAANGLKTSDQFSIPSSQLNIKINGEKLKNKAATYVLEPNSSATKSYELDISYRSWQKVF